MTSSVKLVNKAIFLHQQGNLRDAETIYKKVLDVHPKNFHALHGLGIISAQRGTLQEAEELLRKALSVDSKVASCFHNHGTVLARLRRFEDAVNSYNNAIKLAPNHAPIVYSDRGNAIFELKRYDEALAAYDEALRLKPDLAEAWLGRGNVFRELERYDEALAAYDRALGLKPDLAEAWLGRGNVFAELERRDEAFAAYDKALALKPDLAEAWCGRGDVYRQLKRRDEAFAAYDKALALKPNLAEAWCGRGDVFTELKRVDDALYAYDKALALKPDLIGLEGARLHSKMCICDWSRFDAECEHLISSVKNEKGNADPFSLLCIYSSAQEQLECAKIWIAKKYPASTRPIWSGEVYTHDKIRIGYVSADFHQHATSILMAGMFECHDKAQFEVTAISIGPDDSSEMRYRLRNAFERFLDVRSLSDNEIARRIRQTEIDILIDLKGFTDDERLGIFAYRPAPIQTTYLGFPGTIGADYIDYMIADQTLVPQLHQKYYKEKMVYLPDSYQVNDIKRAVSEKVFSREEAGLPQSAFIFCCFNNSYKILPDVFDCWMRILKKVEGSALWLFERNETATRNLRIAATAKGVNPERLVFAKYIPARDHLARCRLADLFLDTLPCNAHTTASDALWAGLPVLTCLGETFAGRVAASLLNAIHLPELITTTLEAYEQMAVNLATHPEKLAAIKHKLAENRLTTPLFDTKLFTKHIEAAYAMMYERHQAGLTPDHIVVPSGH